MSDLQELKAHVRWLEDEVSHGTAVDDRLDEIDGRVDQIHDRLDEMADAINRNADVLKTHADALNRLADAFENCRDVINAHGGALKQFVDAVTAAVAPKPQPSPFADVFGAAFKPDEPRQPAAKPKPRKPKLSVVQDGDEGPGAAQ